MYNLPHFKAQNEQDVLSFMKAHPFITLCGVDENSKPVATHIPVLIEERNNKLVLVGHVMQKQKHTLAFARNTHVLAIFSGANSYISASWYDVKNIASTWDYQAVHASGEIKFLSEDALYQLLKKLTEHFEGNVDSPALVSKMDDDYIANNMKAIIAFEIEITSIEHTFKLSQNRNRESYDNIIQHLQQGNAQQQYITQQMLQQKDQLF